MAVLGLRQCARVQQSLIACYALIVLSAKVASLQVALPSGQSTCSVHCCSCSKAWHSWTQKDKSRNASVPAPFAHTNTRSKCHFPARARCSLFPYEKYLNPCQLWRASGRLSRALGSRNSSTSSRCSETDLKETFLFQKTWLGNKIISSWNISQGLFYRFNLNDANPCIRWFYLAMNIWMHTFSYRRNAKEFIRW